MVMAMVVAMVMAMVVAMAMVPAQVVSQCHSCIVGKHAQHASGACLDTLDSTL